MIVLRTGNDDDDDDESKSLTVSINSLKTAAQSHVINVQRRLMPRNIITIALVRTLNLSLTLNLICSSFLSE